MKAEELQIRPYARLLTMLGDQLIKNERIALVELIKNSYDADASRVEVRFESFNKDMTHNPDSHILVRDDGIGMTHEVIRDQWMNPAAPKKFLDKQQGKRKTHKKKRIIQGEKGIGRFAALKLGKIIRVITRPPQVGYEIVLDYDFARFDENFLYEAKKSNPLYLDEIKINCLQTEPTKFLGFEHGTLIEIHRLKGSWNDKIVDQLCRDISKLTDPVSRITHKKPSNGFEIAIFCNGEPRSIETENVEELKSLVENKPVLSIKGRFNSRKNIFFYQTQLGKHEISMKDPNISGLRVWREHFSKDVAGEMSRQKYECGNFKFQFYIFDFSHNAEGRYALTRYEKDLIKSHRIYLYRDNMRVYPYGDPDDDWLKIDVTRGIGRAGDFFSNDQIIGWIEISQEGNPALRDKTNREGLIETGGAADDLIFLVQTFLSYIKQHPFAQYRYSQIQRNTAQFVREGVVAKHLSDLKKMLEKSGNKSSVAEVKLIQAEYQREKKYLSERAEVTEDLAGVGLSVEMASHDIMLLMSRAQDIGKKLARSARKSNNEEIQAKADMLVGVLQQIADGMRDVQSLFKSSRRRRKVLKVEPLLNKIYQIYKSLLDERNIDYQKVTLGALPLTANTTDGVIMQVLINLFDNASYWLDTISPMDRKICVTINSEQGVLIFSDNGPGIDTEDLPYIFEPFYSGKGQGGRGLGLYIARQLLERQDYSIEVVEDHQKVLPGANFIINFVKEETQWNLEA